MIGRAETVNESEDEARRVAVPQGSEPACLAPRLLSSGRSDLIYGHVVVDGGHPGVEHRVRAWVLGRAAAAAPFASTCAGRLGADLVVVGPGVAAAVCPCRGSPPEHAGAGDHAGGYEVVTGVHPSPSPANEPTFPLPSSNRSPGRTRWPP